MLACAEQVAVAHLRGVAHTRHAHRKRCRPWVSTRTSNTRSSASSPPSSGSVTCSSPPTHRTTPSSTISAHSRCAPTHNTRLHTSTLPYMRHAGGHEHTRTQTRTHTHKHAHLHATHVPSVLRVAVRHGRRHGGARAALPHDLDRNRRGQEGLSLLGAAEPRRGHILPRRARKDPLQPVRAYEWRVCSVFLYVRVRVPAPTRACFHLYVCMRLCACAFFVCYSVQPMRTCIIVCSSHHGITLTRPSPGTACLTLSSSK